MLGGRIPHRYYIANNGVVQHDLGARDRTAENIGAEERGFSLARVFTISTPRSRSDRKDELCLDLGNIFLQYSKSVCTMTWPYLIGSPMVSKKFRRVKGISNADHQTACIRLDRHLMWPCICPRTGSDVIFPANRGGGGALRACRPLPCTPPTT